MGAEGRMGATLQRICSATPGLSIYGLVERAGHPLIGKTTGLGIPIVDTIEEVAKPGAIVIDFTGAAATLALIPKLPKLGLKAVIGTTGMGEAGDMAIAEAAKNTAIVFSPNMSVGVNLVFKLSELMARALPSTYAIEVIEAHHGLKKDSPSGTALEIAKQLAKGREWNLNDVACYGREGMVGERPEKQIGIHAVRGGDIVGDHTVLFAGPSERIELKHVSHSRDALAQGAATAAQFLKTKNTGLFDMMAVLGI